MQGSLRSRFAFLLAAAGLGLCGYAGLQWRDLPQYSETDLKASAELNLQLDLARKKAPQPSPEEKATLLQQERSEIDASIRNDHEQVLKELALGLALLVFAGGQWLMARLLRNTSY
jgi:uncharacterized protein HemX